MLTQARSPFRAMMIAALLVVATVAGVIAIVVGVLARFGAEQCTLGAPGPVAGPPAQLVPLYEAAAAKYQLGPMGPAYLAAVNELESGFGQNLGTSSAGAVGFMQFLPSTWATEGVTPTGAPAPQGPAGWNNPGDAVFSAANYLSRLGAPGNWWQAIYEWGGKGVAEADQATVLARDYYDQGLQAQGAAGGTATPVSSSSGATGNSVGTTSLGSAAPAPTASSGSCAASVPPGVYANPFTNSVNLTPMRIDMGVDYAAAGQIDAIGSGRITYASSPGHSTGWPTCNLTTGGTIVSAGSSGGAIVYQLTSGPDSGKFVYIAEQIVPLVHSGRVQAGQPIAALGPTTPNATPCIETGWASGAGDGTQASADGQAAPGGDPGQSRTYCGNDFSNLLTATGAPPGLTLGKPVVGTSC